MSINKAISIQNPVIDAITLLGLDHDKDKPVFTRWAELAEKEIGTQAALERKRVVLTIEGCAACLPNDAEILEGAILGDHGCGCGDLFDSTFCGQGGVFSVNNSSGDMGSFLIVDVVKTGEQPYGFVNYTIQDNKLVFSADYDGKKVTVQYQGLKTDCDGFIEISQNHVEAITEFIMWKHYVRKKRKSSAEFQQMMLHQKEWFRLCSHARADDNQLTPPERERIAQMISDPYAGRGLAIGMRTTLGFGTNIMGL